MGFETIYGYFVHPVLSGDALQRITHSPFNAIAVSNTIAVVADLEGARVDVFDVSGVIAKTIEQLV